MAAARFRAFNIAGHYIRHRNFLGELTKVDRPAEDFNFTVIRRGDQGRISLRSVNLRDRYLRHRDFRIRLEAPAGAGDTVFELDSTFFQERGLADPDNGQAFSFRSVNFPHHYLRHRNFSLFLDPEDSPNLANDATFIQEGVPVIID